MGEVGWDGRERWVILMTVICITMKGCNGGEMG